MTKSIEAVAYHEAGHFVACYLRNPAAVLANLTIQPDLDEGYLGLCRHGARATRLRSPRTYRGFDGG